MDHFEIIEIDGNTLDLSKMSLDELKSNFDKLTEEEKNLKGEINQILESCK